MRFKEAISDRDGEEDREFAPEIYIDAVIEIHGKFKIISGEDYDATDTPGK